MLGEIPSLKDRVTIVRQLWDLTQDVLVNFQYVLFVCLPMSIHGNSEISELASLLYVV